MSKETIPFTACSLARILTVILILILVVACPTQCKSEEMNLLTPQGERINYSLIKGRQYTLLYIIKPWDGITSKLLTELQKTETGFYGRIKPVIVFTNTRRAVANAYMANLEFKRISHYIDDTFTLTLKTNPSTLPCCLLLSADDVEIIRTSSPDHEFLRQLTMNPERYIRLLTQQKSNNMKTKKRIHKVHSPWGPPHIEINNEKVKNQ